MSAPLPAPRSITTRSDLPWFSPHEDAAGFFNPWTTRHLVGPTQVGRWMLSPNPMRADKRRSRPPEAVSAADDAWRAMTPGARVQWLGHASALVQIDGVTVVIDPVLGRVNYVMPRLQRAPLTLDQLPPIDVIVVTHGHYDHLDGPSVRALATRYPDAVVVVPKGLDGYLPAACRRVIPLDWWQAIAVDGVDIVMVPAQHWHRRGVRDTNRALWGGVVVRGSRSVYHSGDTGYFDGFAAIGEELPGLDLAILPLGAYEPRWFMAPQHMAPEDSVRAFEATGAKRLLGMHWGTFDLTDEPVDHGAASLLPRVIQERALDSERFVVVAPGGVVDLASGATVGAIKG